MYKLDIPDYLLNLDVLTEEEKAYAEEISTWTPDKIESKFSYSFDPEEYLLKAIENRDIFGSINKIKECSKETQITPLADEVALPPKAKGDNRLTLVLDLDETLIRTDEFLDTWDRMESVCVT